MRELIPGTILFHNTYGIVRLLGRGGMGAVYEARHIRLGHTIALKETFYSSDDRQMIDAFFREAQLLAHLAHPALPKVSDFFKENDSHFIVMEFVAGENLRKLLADHGGSFPCEQVLVWADQLLEVVEYLHSQPTPVIHRDIKPDNLKLTSEGKIVLLDFGLAKRHAPGASQSIHGLTESYAPLEQFQGVSTDQRSDIFSLGATLYHLMTCELPIKAEVRDEIVKQGVSDTLQTVNQINPRIPESVAILIQKAMAIRPENRFQTATEFREALRKVGQARSSVQKVAIPVPSPPPPPAPVIVSPNPENSVLGGLKKWLREFGPKPEPPSPPLKQVEPPPRVQSPPVFKNSLGMEFVLIPAGEFQMGSNNAAGNEKPAHKVKISEAFYLGKYQVTQAQWQAVMGDNPSYFKGDRLPVERVSWEDCQKFIKKLNAKGEGAYRLPTEAEWEYACRAGTTGAYAGNLDEMAWYGNNSGRQRIDAQTLWATDSSKYVDALLANGCQTHPVGEKKPNGWGLYDMHGSVWEWCEDWYDGGYYAKSPESDPKGPSGGSGRVIRGGSWYDNAVYCRSADRDGYTPGYRFNDLGFRLVRITALNHQPRVERSIPKSDPRRVDPVVIPPPLLSPPTSAPIIVSPNPKNPNLGGFKRQLEGFSRKPEPPPPPKGAELQPRVQLPAVFKNSLGMEFMLIPAGEFQMGSSLYDNEMPVHKVRISQPFYLGKYQVTQAQWQAVMGNNPSNFKGDRLPVETVSWDDVQEFIKRLNEKGEGTYRLPREAEWEYACRAGTRGDYGGTGKLKEMGWYGGNSGDKTHPVGQKKPNDWGLYDMHGNVWEWCEDWYDSGYYAKSPESDPKGPSEGSDRVNRGGSWDNTAVYCRSAGRSHYTPGSRGLLGFRLVRITDLDQPRVERSILESNQRRVDPVVIAPPPLPPPASAPIIISPTPENPNLGGFKRQLEGFSRKPEPPPPPKGAELQPRVQLPAVFKNSLGMEFVLIPVGEFQMGSNNGGEDEKPVHTVKISQPFYLGKYQVTQAQWQAVMGDNPSRFKGGNLPVEMVLWEDCQKFIQRLNAKGEGAYRLPTEAEWEYACRAGTTGDYAGDLNKMGWYASNSGNKTHPIGQKKPNGWGLYDMHGNVWEWCEDWYDSGYYAKSLGSDPKGPSGGSFRVFRGGGWSITAVDCRSANRGSATPGYRGLALGFRLLRTAR